MRADILETSSYWPEVALLWKILFPEATELGPRTRSMDFVEALSPKLFLSYLNLAADEAEFK